MTYNLNWVFKNIHLIVSVIIVIPTAIIYGSPSILPEHLDIQVNTTDLSNMLKAIMCLYLGISFVWILGIWKTKYWKNATQLKGTSNNPVWNDSAEIFFRNEALKTEFSTAK